MSKYAKKKADTKRKPMTDPLRKARQAYNGRTGSRPRTIHMKDSDFERWGELVDKLGVSKSEILNQALDLFEDHL